MHSTESNGVFLERLLVGVVVLAFLGMRHAPIESALISVWLWIGGQIAGAL
jgi:hypothetical protein